MDTLTSQVAELREKLNIATGALATVEVELARPPTVVPVATVEATPVPHEMTNGTGLQEVGLIENYAATRFYPETIVVLKDVPVRIYLTRLHREHINKFSIDPFYRSSEVILPGEVGVIEFVADKVGEFKIRNVGHNFDASLIVVATKEEVQQYFADRGKQMYALIHSIDDFQIFPDRLVVQEGIPVTVHNISLIAEHKVSFGPFHTPQDINIKPKEITPINFTPEEPGEYKIQHELHGFSGELIVEGN
ncbi:MAG: hypothetical protein J4N84_05855 [Chloroflexi bacterium]|nr:hypothetical protein [Chloroflexota bacterium]MCI0894408.1 hypothetical protein [Chloroflexota bacterium]